MFERHHRLLTVSLFCPALLLFGAAVLEGTSERGGGERTEILPLGADEYLVHRQFLERGSAISSGCYATGQGRLNWQPYGEPVGFKLFSIRPESIYAELGLQNGDLIQSINDFELSTPDRALEAYSRLRSARIFAVRLIRDGQPRLFRYYLEED